MSSSMMSCRIARTCARLALFALDQVRGDLGIAQDRGEGLTELVGERRRQLAHRRDTADVGEVAPQPLYLFVRAPARQDIGEHPAEQPETLHELVRPRPLGSDGVEGQRAQDRAVVPQREHQAGARVSLLVARAVGHRLRRKVAEHGEPDALAPLDARDRPGKMRARQRRGQPRDAFPGPRDASGRPVRQILVENGPIDTRELRDPVKRLLDGRLQLARRDVDEAGRQVSQLPLEAEAIGEQGLRAPPAPQLKHETDGEEHDREGQAGPDDELPSVRPHRANGSRPRAVIGCR